MKKPPKDSALFLYGIFAVIWAINADATDRPILLKNRKVNRDDIGTTQH